MIEIIVFLYIFSILLDINSIIDLRGILFSFLLAKGNRKSATKIHKSQSFINRLTLKYIEQHTTYEKDFKIYYKIHLLFLIILPTMYILAAIFTIISLKTGAVLLSIFSVAKLALSIYLRFQQNSNRIFKYDKKYK